MATKYKFSKKDEAVDDYDKEIEESIDIVQKRSFSINRINEEINLKQEEILRINNDIAELEAKKEAAKSALSIQ